MAIVGQGPANFCTRTYAQAIVNTYLDFIRKLRAATFREAKSTEFGNNKTKMV